MKEFCILMRVESIPLLNVITLKRREFDNVLKCVMIHLNVTSLPINSPTECKVDKVKQTQNPHLISRGYFIKIRSLLN